MKTPIAYTYTPTPELERAIARWTDGQLDYEWTAAAPGLLREAIRSETDRRYQSARMEYAEIMAGVNEYVRRQHATACPPARRECSILRPPIQISNQIPSHEN